MSEKHDCFISRDRTCNEACMAFDAGLPDSPCRLLHDLSSLSRGVSQLVTTLKTQAADRTRAGQKPPKTP